MGILMTKTETAMLLEIVKTNYVKYFRDISKDEYADLVNVWHICISDYDFNLAQAGLKVYFSSETKGFPPSVGQIIDCIHKIQSGESERLTELDAWGMVYKAICNSTYSADEEYAKLPGIVQRAVGDPARLREWAKLDTSDVQTVTQSNFMRSFRAIQEQQKEYKKMPNEVKLLTEYGLHEGQTLKIGKPQAKEVEGSTEDMSSTLENRASPEHVNAIMARLRKSMALGAGRAAGK